MINNLSVTEYLREKRGLRVEFSIVVFESTLNFKVSEEIFLFQ
jgi:hypothetical protein